MILKVWMFMTLRILWIEMLREKKLKQHLRYVGPESRGHFSDLIQVRKPGNAGNGKGRAAWCLKEVVGVQIVQSSINVASFLRCTNFLWRIPI